VKYIHSHITAIGIFCGISLSPAMSLAQNKTPSNVDIFTNMFSAIQNVKTLRADVSTDERIIDHINHTHFAVKLNVSPYEAYSKDLDKGVEILYREGKNNGEAIINPNGFPYINVHLDPMGKTMRKDQHQTITRLGFKYISDVLYHFIATYPDAYTHYIKRDADTVYDGNACYKMEINFSTYANATYVVKNAGETVMKLAATYRISEYQLLTLNNISWYNDELSIGRKILLPNAYAKTTILFIRKDNYLPVVIRIFDDKGFFEQYTYSHLQLNATIPDSEFTENYPGYHF
jgi:outer membrane lipoprotein-sorting protein